MSSRIVFLSLFLGLAAGTQQVDLQTDAAVKSVRIMLAGREVAVLTQPPWHAALDFGISLDPRKLEAIGYDSKGDEIGRATQILNLPRSFAEVEIVLQYGKLGPTRVELRWHHLQFVRPKSATIFLDRTKLAVDKDFRARLPEVDWLHPHLITAEMRWRDGLVARREIVVGGAVTDTAQSELTPIALRKISAQEPASYENCLSSDGVPIRTAAVEKPTAIVIFVRDPDPGAAVHALDPTHRARVYGFRDAVRLAAHLDSDTNMRMLWPIAKKFHDPGTQASSLLFNSSTEADASKFGLIWLLTADYNGSYYDEPLRMGEAVAVAGLRAIGESRRRAVVLVVSNRQDQSSYPPAAVRRYLADLGVPLFVWSPTGPRPDLADSWGEVDDISNIAALRAAADRVRATLDAQRIAWVDVDPLRALQLRADERCGVATVARLGAM